MKIIIYILSFFIVSTASAVDFNDPKTQENRKEEGLRFYRQCEEIAKIYARVEGKGFFDITEELKDPRLAKENRKIVLFEYPSDGLQIKGYISYVDSDEKKPLLVLLRGGNRLFGVMHPVTSLSLMSNYTVVGTCYRDGVSEGLDEFGGNDVNDVKNLVTFIPDLERKLGIEIESEDRFILGGSRGGMEMFLALNRDSELQDYFDKAISLSGLLDMNVVMKSRPDMVKMFIKGFGYDGDPNWIAWRNPIENIDNIALDFPILIIQGGEDDRVSLEEGLNMARALKEKGCTVDYLEIEGGGHCLKNKAEERAKILTHWLEEK